MTLSSLFQRPALTSIISGLVTNSVVTTSPAILVGLTQGGDYPDDPNPSGSGAQYNLQVNSGTDIIWRLYGGPGYVNTEQLNVPNGVDCPNGISVTTSYPSGASAAYVANAQVTVNYILK
jgi:hypothetical protein